MREACALRHTPAKEREGTNRHQDTLDGKKPLDLGRVDEELSFHRLGHGHVCACEGSEHLTRGTWMIQAMKKQSSCFDVTDADSGRLLEKSLHDWPNMHNRHVAIRLPPEYVWMPNLEWHSH
jgi:hypothetical protein